MKPAVIFRDLELVTHANGVLRCRRWLIPRGVRGRRESVSTAVPPHPDRGALRRKGDAFVVMCMLCMNVLRREGATERSPCQFAKVRETEGVFPRDLENWPRLNLTNASLNTSSSFTVEFNHFFFPLYLFRSFVKGTVQHFGRYPYSLSFGERVDIGLYLRLKYRDGVRRWLA